MSYAKICPMCGPYGHCTGRCAFPAIQPTYAPNRDPNRPGQAVAGWITPKGCICPPGSETTCQRKDCGRKEPTHD
jgi:hypothetical protein